MQFAAEQHNPFNYPFQRLGRLQRLDRIAKLSLLLGAGLAPQPAQRQVRAKRPGIRRDAQAAKRSLDIGLYMLQSSQRA